MVREASGQQRGDAARLLVDLTPGEPDHAEAGQLEVEVSGAVRLEGVRVVVDAAAVGFHHELVGRPVEVDAVGLLVAVDDGVGQAGPPDQLQEAPLQLAAGERQLGKEAGELAPELGGSGLAAVALSSALGHAGTADQLADEGLLDGAVEVLRVARRYVDQGPFDRGGRDAVAACDVQRQQRGETMEADTASRRGSPLARHRHVHRPTLRTQQTMVRGRGQVAQDGVVAYGQDGGHQPSERTGIRGPDRIDTPMEAKQLTPLEPNADLIRTDPGSQQLPPGHDALLAGRQLGDDLVRCHRL